LSNGEKVISFDGSDDQVNINNDTELRFNPLTDKLTLCGWFNASATSASNAFLVGKNAAYGLAMYNNFMPNVYFGSGSTNLYSTIPFVANSWYYVAGTFNITDSKIYMNGAFNRTSAISGTATQSSAVAMGGVGVGGYYFNGKIDNVRVYNRVLSDDEIAQIYNFEKTKYQ